MDVIKILFDLRQERERIDEAIVALGRIAARSGKPPLKPGAWIEDLKGKTKKVNRRPARLGSSSLEHSLGMRAMQLQHANRVIETVGGNRQRAAQLLGISRATLYRLVDGASARRPTVRSAS